MPLYINPTMQAFGYPDSLIADLDAWVVLLRLKQITLGSLVLAAADPATAVAELAPRVVDAQATAMRTVDRVLRGQFACDKVNYLMLMMVDPHVHFHVIPRYSAPPTLAGRSFPDAAWPKPPVLSDALDLTDAERAALHALLKGAFAA
ncbi:MAG: HIT family protein [Alphaproteobacteria bacterium]|nr:HIT family protein [Alphaproteobacteria bacterium]